MVLVEVPNLLCCCADVLGRRSCHSDLPGFCSLPCAIGRRTDSTGLRFPGVPRGLRALLCCLRPFVVSFELKFSFLASRLIRGVAHPSPGVSDPPGGGSLLTSSWCSSPFFPGLGSWCFSPFYFRCRIVSVCDSFPPLYCHCGAYVVSWVVWCEGPSRGNLIFSLDLSCRNAACVLPEIVASGSSTLECWFGARWCVLRSRPAPCARVVTPCVGARSDDSR